MYVSPKRSIIMSSGTQNLHLPLTYVLKDMTVCQHVGNLDKKC